MASDDRPPTRLALAVADVNWFTTENLFLEAESADVSLLTLRCMDYLNGWRKGLRPWSRGCRLRRSGPQSFHRDLVLPSGWMKRFPRLGMRPIARTIRRFWERAGATSRRALVLTYPHYVRLLDMAEPDASLYYNLDDYTLYWPKDAAAVRRYEREAVLRTGATVCVSRARADALRTAIPEAAERIHHLPHGTPAAFLAEHPLHLPASAPDDISRLPRPLLGYIGSAERRVDWPLLVRLSESMPEASLVIVGRAPLPSAHPPDWYREWETLASLPNVHAIGWRTQAELPGYYGCFDVILIPYRTDDPFNQACSPTKIMDGMGSGRPIVATDIPECRLYREQFDVPDSVDDFVSAVQAIVARGSDDGRAGLRNAFAREHSCRRTAERVLQLLDDQAGPRRGV